MVVLKKSKIAVYGTLRKGWGNFQRLLADETEIGQFETDPEYTMYSLGGFPALLKNGHTSIVMEVFEIPAEKLRKVDALEGFGGVGKEGNMYNRVQIDTPFGKAYTYIWNSDVEGLPIVESGDWTDYVKTRAVTSLVK